MRCRTILAGFACGVACVSCVNPVPVNQRDPRELRDPPFEGKSYVLSDAELHTILAVARSWLAPRAPSCPVLRLEVRSQTEVWAWTCIDEGPNLPGRLVLEKRGSGWRVTEERGPNQMPYEARKV
jgi:hypothetical protein